MITWYQFVIYSAANILLIYTILMLVNAFFDRFEWIIFKRVRDFIIMATTMEVIVIFTVFMKFYDLFPIELLIINQILIYVIIIWFILIKFKTTWYMPFLMISLYWCVSLIVEWFIVIYLSIFMVEVDIYSFSVQMIGTIIFCVGYVVFSYVISHIKAKYFDGFVLPKTLLSYVVMTPIVLLVIYNFAFTKLLSKNTLFEGYIIMILGMLLFVLLIYLWVFQRKKVTEVQQLENEMQSLSGYAATMDNMYDEIRHYKHDVNNIILGLRAYVETGDNTAAIKYYDNQIKNIAPFSSDSYQFIEAMNHLSYGPLKGLLISKLERMKEYGLKPTVTVTDNFDNIPSESSELYRVISDLLDIAIGMAATSDEKTIHFQFYLDNDDRIISISNSYTGEVSSYKLHIIEKAIADYNNVSLHCEELGGGYSSMLRLGT